MQQKIVITGGPGTGKSSVLEQLERVGFTCMPEISREVTLKAQKSGIEQLFLEDPLLFSRMLLEGRTQQYIQAEKTNTDVVFFDRGIHDVVAYLDYIRQKYDAGFVEEARKHPYTHVLIMPPWEAIYKTDNERYESFEQAQTIHNFLKKTYRSFGYNLTEVPTGPVDDRVDFILNHLNLTSG